jgi:hypothetical protein
MVLEIATFFRYTPLERRAGLQCIDRRQQVSRNASGVNDTANGDARCRSCQCDIAWPAGVLHCTRASADTVPTFGLGIKRGPRI